MLDELDDPNQGRSAPTRDLGDFDPARVVKERALSWGQGAINSSLNSSAEALVSGLGEHARARMNFHIDRDGKLRGEGDVLLPLYDTPRTVVFSQIGARNMNALHDKDRWIGNFGLGQRWFPDATEEDSGDWMFGYNVFFDKDFTRAHQRGGVGVELQYDWLRLAANHYFPLSGWKGSYDFDRRFVEERPARGWDARFEAYFPFYRHLALTGGFSQWAGDRVDVLGGSLKKDPKVWNYGVKYTPFPLLSGSITRRNAEGGPGDTEFGLSFTYHFGVPWHQQISPAKVDELRTVSGSRYEFVERENRMFLEYRAKPGAYRIVCEKPDPDDKNTCEEDVKGGNRFSFRVSNGFGEVENRLGVYLHEDGGGTAALEQPFTEWGKFRVQLVDPLPPDGKVRVSIQVGHTTQEFFLKGTANSLEVSPNTLTQGAATDVTFTVTRNGKAVGAGVSVKFVANTDLGLSAVTRTTDNNGRITLKLTAPTTGTPGEKTVSATIDGEKVDCKITVNLPLGIYIIDFSDGGGVVGGADFTDIVNGPLYSTASLTAKVIGADGLPVSDATVTWSVVSARNDSPAMMSGWGSKKTGLTWGNAPESGKGGYAYVFQRLREERIVSDTTNNTSTTDASGESTMQLTDIVGERVITVEAKVTIDGTEYTASPQNVSFGDGPLSVFRAAPEAMLIWAQSYEHCNDSTYSGDPADWDISTDWVGGDHMPTKDQLQAVSALDISWGNTNPNSAAQGAAWAAGWSVESEVWTGEAFLLEDADAVVRLVTLYDGNEMGGGLHFDFLAVCVWQH